jgi:endonuclease
MSKTLYHKPMRLLLNDMIKDLGLQPGQVFTTSRATAWFKDKYPDLATTNVSPALIQASTNSPGRLHHSPTASDDLLFKVGRGQFRLYEPGKDPTPIHELVPGDVAREEASDESLDEEEEVLAGRPGSSEFLLEQDLQRYLSENLQCIEPGLKLYEAEGIRGLEFEAGGRRIDILAVDKTGAYVVIELKVSKGYDKVVGQLLRYTNWIRQNLAEQGQRVRGVIICRSISDDLRLACAGNPDIELYEYELSVAVSRVAALEL